MEFAAAFLDCSCLFSAIPQIEELGWSKKLLFFLYTIIGWSEDSFASPQIAMAIIKLYWK